MTIQPYNFQSNLICYNGPFTELCRKIRIYVTNVAEQIDEFMNVENPPNCVGEIRVFSRASFLVSLLLVSLRNTSTQFTLPEGYFLVFYTEIVFI